MLRYRPYIIFFSIVAAGLVAVLLVSLGYYPIALVEGDFISAKSFVGEYNAASIYYGNLLKTYEPALRSSEKLSQIDLQLAVMNSLIEKSLIAEGAKDEVGEDFGYLVSNKLDRFRKDLELERAASALYGMSKDEFLRRVLIPQAEREILAGRLFLRDERIEDWLLSAKESANVVIFSSRFKWNDEGVVELN